MNLKLSTDACDPARLESFLRGDLSPAGEREFTLHLNICADCRRTLEEQAAAPESWREAEELLQPAQFEEPHFDDPAGRKPLEIQQVLDALGPTDDPEMLGRLGGYEISGVVGAGGMGVVLKAIDKSLDRTVAIKVLAPHLATSGAARKRFAREAKAAAAVLHPNVIAIHSVSNDESLPYLVMPYVRGPSLQRRLDREGPLSLTEILRIGSQIAAGLAAAHAQGLVHRDIKPSNILLEDGVERVTLTDFGLARAVDDATITHSGVIAGTPQYMSPEQARGEGVDQRSDLFSLGSVLFAVCTGRPPFRADSTLGVMRRITDDEPAAIRDVNPEIPEWLCAIVARLMAKRAADRFHSAAHVADLLAGCLAHVQQPAAVPLPPSLASEGAGGWSRFLTLGKGVLVMLASLGVVLLALGLWAGTDPPDIAGQWKGPEWGEVVLEQTGDGQYSGTYTDTFGQEPGKIELAWSRIERRFNGVWREGEDRFGELSVRLAGDEIRGAHTTNAKSKINPATPRLADLAWSRTPPLPPPLPATPASLPGTLLATKEHVADIKQLLKSTQVTTNYLAELFERTPGSDSEYRLRPEIVSIPILTAEKAPLDFSPLGIVLYMPAQKAFYLQWDAMGASTRHYYGPFYAVVLDRLGKPVPKSNAASDSATFGPMIERFIPRNAAPSFIWFDLDTGKSLSAAEAFPGRKEEEITEEECSNWRTKNGLDVAASFDDAPALKSLDPEFFSLPVKPDQWNKMTPAILDGIFRATRDRDQSKIMPVGEKVPVTFIFRTRHGGRGILEITGIGEDPQFIAIRYKLVQSAKAPAVPPRGQSGPPAAGAPPARLEAPAVPEGGALLLKHFSFDAEIRSIAASPDGKLLAVANDHPPQLVLVNGKSRVPDVWKVRASILDAETGKMVVELSLMTADEDLLLVQTERVPLFQISALAFSPDGNTLAVGTNVGQVKLFSAKTGELVRSFDDDAGKRTDQRTPEKFQALTRAIGSVSALAFSPDGSFLAVCGSSFGDSPLVRENVTRYTRRGTGPGRVKVWDAQSGKLRHDLAGHSDAEGLAYSADGSLLATAGRWSGESGHGAGVIVWHAESGKRASTIAVEANGSAYAVVFSPAKKLVAFAVTHYDKEHDTYSTEVRVGYALSGITEWQRRFPGAARPLAFSPDGRWVAALGHQSLRLIDVASGQVLRELRTADDSQGRRWNTLVLLPGQRMVIAGVDEAGKGSITIWSLSSPPEEKLDSKPPSERKR